MDGIVNKMDLLLVALGIHQNNKTNQPQEPIHRLYSLYALRDIIFEELP